MAVSKLKG